MIKNFKSNNTFPMIEKNLSKMNSPRVLELGVNRGRSSEKFLNILSSNNGNLFSIDIKDCSKVIASEKFNFYQCNDLDVEKILNHFPSLRNGIDLLYIDSYHDPSHVKLLLKKWWTYLNKSCHIYFDDTESYIYKIQKQNILSIINDSISNVIKEFYYSNYEDISYTKYYTGSGLSKFVKHSEKGKKANLKKIWNYNIVFSYLYKILKKLKFFLSNFKKL